METLRPGPLMLILIGAALLWGCVAPPPYQVRAAPEWPPLQPRPEVARPVSLAPRTVAPRTLRAADATGLTDAQKEELFQRFEAQQRHQEAR